LKGGIQNLKKRQPVGAIKGKYSRGMRNQSCNAQEHNFGAPGRCSPNRHKELESTILIEMKGNGSG